MIVEHYELGSHFLTFYGKDLVGLLALAKEAYPKFCEDFPEMAWVQQKDFVHEPEDPKVYHLNGLANDLYPKSFRHFHIRMGRVATIRDLKDTIEFLSQFTYMPDMNHNLSIQKEYYTPPDDGLKYLDFIAEIKNG